jgi:hypothetical protein
MKKLPDYVFIVPNKDRPDMGAGFILRTNTPFELGRVIKVAPVDLFEEKYRLEFKPLILSAVPGYSIMIHFAGNLYGYRMEVTGPSWEQNLQAIFDKMAKFFLEEKIHNNLGYYKRYKI